MVTPLVEWYSNDSIAIPVYKVFSIKFMECSFKCKTW